MSQSTIINQSVSMNRFCPIEALIFLRECFVFPQSVIVQIFSIHLSLLFKQEVGDELSVCVLHSKSPTHTLS